LRKHKVKAMEQIEQQLTLPAAMLSRPVSTGQMLDLVNQLLGTALDAHQSGIASSLYDGLFRLVGQERSDNVKINKVWT
jgi:hypothetical protein